MKIYAQEQNKFDARTVKHYFQRNLMSQTIIQSQLDSKIVCMDENY